MSVSHRQLCGTLCCDLTSLHFWTKRFVTPDTLTRSVLHGNGAALPHQRAVLISVGFPDLLAPFLDPTPDLPEMGIFDLRVNFRGGLRPRDGMHKAARFCKPHGNVPQRICFA